MGKQTCPACGEKFYIVSIFGSICGRCLYNPAIDPLPDEPPAPMERDKKGR